MTINKENTKKMLNDVENGAETARKKFMAAAGIAAIVEVGCWCVRALTNTDK